MDLGRHCSSVSIYTARQLDAIFASEWVAVQGEVCSHQYAPNLYSNRG